MKRISLYAVIAILALSIGYFANDSHTAQDLPPSPFGIIKVS
ncbi:hypothetical protein [Tumebacillus algifaecis]|nr:hypothetical protein [Tumebacillus algifaecis]